MVYYADDESLKERVQQQEARIELLTAQVNSLMDRLESLGKWTNRRIFTCLVIFLLDSMNRKLSNELLSYQRKPCDSCRNCLFIADGRGGPDDRPVGYYHVYANPGTFSFSGNLLVHPYGDLCNCICHQ